MASNTMIEVKSLSASFDDRQVLKNVSFTINEREIAVILGGSGSGKSTIFRHMLRLYDVPYNTIRIFDKDIADLNESEQLVFFMKLGVFYQNGALLNSLTVGENVALALEQHTSLPPDIIENIVRTKLELVNLGDAYQLFPSQLSGGMLKRAALARAIIMDPPLLFCDEPGAGLDPVSLASLDQLILNLRNLLGITVVMVTHEVSSILRIADKIIFLDDGVITFKGTPQDALKSDIPVVKDFFSKGTGATLPTDH
ncbi:ABC transporter ATP-binding protein [Natronoflexus pectinivorans]|uniref:Phospholipid/cholesterol/gamma-HCH transport system ATP-binding protein n=1 Tax=Natronoflexus pectinivorans TaxID=682526 RepID=A0A4R2GGZ2_9BACT|nr:ATP-binding cassette domain-containing protein [Natronoflexus pectinivorans]TCO07639.1 phospholipid/cholesterol/gamma-HCH transport system ATP-binding protein [Natronoflexus pectinivorans]